MKVACQRRNAFRIGGHFAEKDDKMNQFQSIDEVLSALRRRAWIILLVITVGCVLSLYYALGQQKIYEATAVVQIEEARVPDQLAGATARREGSARRVQLIEQRLMARDNLVRIMEEFDLFTDDPSVTTNERISLMRGAARIQEIINPAQAFSPGGNVPSGLYITVQLGDAQVAADVANELMYSVIEQSRDRNVSRARDTLEFFDAEEVRVGGEIAELDAQIAQFKTANSEILPSSVADLRDQLASLRDTNLELDQQIISLETSSSRQREEVLARQVALIRDQKRLIDDRIGQVQSLLLAAPEVERALNGLERERVRLQEQYQIVTRRKAEAEMGQLLEDRDQTDRFEVLETALAPEFPVSRSRKKTAIMGGVVSVFVGLIAAFVIELANPAIRTAAQMERMLGIQPVVAIPVVTTRRDRTGKGLRALGILLTVLAAIWAGAVFLASRVPAVQDLLGRIIPRVARG